MIQFRTLMMGALIGIPLFAVLPSGQAQENKNASPDVENGNISTENSTAGLVQPAVSLSPSQSISPSGLGLTARVKLLAFSPDGKYLAMLFNPNLVTGVLIIWNLDKNCEQARISDIGAIAGNAPQNSIIWGPNESFITFGTSHNKASKNPYSPWQITLWNPMTGVKIKDVNVRSGYGQLNQAGTKLLVGSGTMEHPVIRIYDTQTWNYQEFNSPGIQLARGMLCWTAENKILAVGYWDRNAKDQNVEGAKSMDVLASLIDPASGQPLKTVMLSPSIPLGQPTFQFEETLTPQWYSVDYAGNKVAVGLGTFKVFDTRNLSIIYIYAPPSLSEGAYGNIAFSPDGNYLYIMDSRTVGSGHGVILNGQTGHVLGTFPSGTRGFAISPSGKEAAMGMGGAVEIFSIN